MELSKQNILFFPRTMGLGGTENVVLQLCEIFKPLVNKIIVCSCGGVNVEKLRKIGIKHYTIPDIENKSPSTLLNVVKKFKSIVNKENISVIHTHHRMAAFYVRLTGFDKKCIFINTSHNTFDNKKLLTRFAYKNCNLVACGEMVKANLQNVYKMENVRVIHNAVKPFIDEVVIEEQLKKAKDYGKFLIGNVGRLSEQKGIEYFIKAVPKVKAEYPEAEFYVIGSGEDEEKLKQLCKELGAEVFFMGYRTDIQNIMAQLDLIVLSSLWEGLPLTPIEAFSVGRTIIATAVDGTVEVVEDGVNGVLIAPRNSQELANQIIWMIGNTEKRKKMEIEAKKTFDNKFSFDSFKNQYVSFYKKCNRS